MLRYTIGITLITISIIVVRALADGKILKKHQYAFWIFIPIFMILFPFVKIDLPISYELNSLFTHAMETASYNIEGNEESYDRDENNSEEQNVLNVGVKSHGFQDKRERKTEQSIIITKQNKTTNLQTKKTVQVDVLLKNIIFSVAASLTSTLVIYNVGFVIYCRSRREYIGKEPSGKLGVYYINHKSTPFLLLNKIYIDKNMEEMSEYIICHEVCHYKHHDHIWVLIRYLVLCLNWYNPVIWIAFVLSGRDCELACDEEVLKILGVDSSENYVETLIGLLKNNAKKSFGFTISTGMNGGYKMMKKRILSIKKPSNLSRKALALSLSTIVILSGCSLFKPDDDTMKVSKDTPWYDCEIIECNYENDEGTSAYCSQCPIGKTFDGYIFSSVNSSSSFGASLFLFSDDGEMISEMDLKSVLYKSFPNIDLYNISQYRDFYIEDDTLKLKCMNVDEQKLMVFDIDIINNSISLADSYEFAQGVGEYNNANEIAHAKSEKYELFVSLYENFTILTIDREGDYFIFTPGEEYSRDLSGYVSDFLPVSDTDFFFYDYWTYKYFVYDASTGTISEETSQYDWIKPYFTWYREDIHNNIASNGNMYFMTPNAIAVPDFENRTMKDIVELEYVDMNRSVFCDQAEMTLSMILNADEGAVEIALAKLNPHEGEYGFKIYKVTKAKVNPHVGKTIITTDGYYLYSIYDAIYSFNRTDKDYFIKLVPNVYSDEEKSTFGSDVQEIYTIGDVGNRMRVDLVAGDCPDVVFYVTRYGQLNNKNCMMDLKPYYDSSKIKDSVFDNIIKASETEDGLYAMPLSFVLNGIIVDRTKYEFEGNGLTYDQFGQFTDRYCNGVNVISRTQMDFINECLRCNFDLFENNGKIDFNCPEFRALAEYTSSNVYELEQEDYWKVNAKDLAPAIGIEGYLGWFSNLRDLSYDLDNADLIGFPSSDARGPVADIRCFASITQSAKCPEGAWKFIESLLGYDFQTELCQPVGTFQNSFPLNKDAFDMVGEQCIETFNYQTMIENFGSTKISAEPNDLETIRNVVGSVEHISKTDTDISIIIYEEIQAYLVGDKNLDDVIKIMNDRAKTVTDERE